MGAVEQKIVEKFGLTLEEAEALVEAKLDTPTKIKAASAQALEAVTQGLSSKLSRWVEQE